VKTTWANLTIWCFVASAQVKVKVNVAKPDYELHDKIDVQIRTQAPEMWHSAPKNERPSSIDSDHPETNPTPA
jgi:hypothetical protein